MSKKEFLRVLREQLEGELRPEEIEVHIRYYDHYITDEIRNGKSEEQVMSELGSPVFIAKTLSEVPAESRLGYEDEAAEEESATENDSEGRFRRIELNGTLARILIPLILVLILVVVVMVVGTVAFVAIRYFLPVLLVLFVIAMFRGRQ